MPVFVQAIPYDSPLIFANTFIPIADKPCYDIALACAKKCYSIEPHQRADVQDLFLQNLPLRSVPALIPWKSTNRQIAERKFAKQIRHSALVRDLYEDIEVVAREYVRVFVLLSQDGADLSGYSPQIRQDLEALRPVVSDYNRRRKSGEDSIGLAPEVFNYVFVQVASHLKTSALLRQHAFLHEILVERVSSAVNGSLLHRE
jgi:hypothetical protein